MARQIGFLKQLVLAAMLAGGAGAAWSERELLAAALGLSGPDDRGGKPGGASASAVPVIVAAVSTADDDVSLAAVGTGRATRSIVLRPEASGKVAEVRLAAGRRFSKGEPLLRLDDAEQRLAFELAETRLEEAERVLARFRRLETSGAATATRLDEASTAAEIARIEKARAREVLDDRTLIAPFDGVAGLPSVEEGAWIDSDDDIATFDDRSVLLVEFDLPEALLSRVRVGMDVTATTPTVPGRTFAGAVSAVDSRIAASSRTVRIRISIPNPEDILRPGASFTVRLDLPGERYFLVPELAVGFSRGALHVWRVRDDRAERIEVTLIRRRDGAVLVDGPLEEGDVLVVEGTQRLEPGKAVRIIGGNPRPST